MVFPGADGKRQGRAVAGSRSNRWHFAIALVLAAVLALGPRSAAAGGAETGAVARADPARSGVATAWFGRRLSLQVQLDQPVPFRVFTLDAPPRLVADFAGLDWSGFDPAAVAAGLRVGRILPGWSRLVLALPAPLALRSAELVPDAEGARLEVRLARVSAADFARVSGAPPGVWPAGAPARAAPAAHGNGAVTVAIDPGHGGIDPGAVRDGVLEKEVALAFARDLSDTLLAAGFRVALTRDRDDFVALDDRVAAARAAGADLLLSIHCNAVDDQAVSGAITFTRSERGSSPPRSPAPGRRTPPTPWPAWRRSPRATRCAPSLPTSPAPGPTHAPPASPRAWCRSSGRSSGSRPD